MGRCEIEGRINRKEKRRGLRNVKSGQEKNEVRGERKERESRRVARGVGKNSLYVKTAQIFPRIPIDL